ncbi:MAG: hypothetical protein ABEI74_01100 [Candidatus Pacearchaeota archaeon]
MVNEEISISKEDLNELLKQIEEVKSTLEILQNKEMMGDIETDEKAQSQGIKPKKLEL